MKTRLIALCTVAACLLAPAAVKFGGGPAPNELLIKEEESVVLPVAFASFNTSLCTEESDTFALSRDAQHWETSDVSLFAILAPADVRLAIFANSGSDTADPTEAASLIQVMVTAMVPELPLLEGLGAIGACTETVT